MTEDQTGSTIILERVPGYAKVLILIETLLVLFLGGWFYEDYTYNTYFQMWLNNYLQTNQLLILGASTGVLTLFIAIGVFMKSRGSKTPTTYTSETMPEDSVPSPTSPPTGGLDHHTEQHLIDMIRRNTNPSQQAPPPSSSSSQGTSGGRMPTLQRVDPDRRPQQ